MGERKLCAGDIVRHFKWETITEEQHSQNMYIYRIVAFATHTETQEKLVIYEPLYSTDRCMYARPYDMFMSEVDHEKYPDIKQKYRLEKIEDFDEIGRILARYGRMRIDQINK